MKTISKAVKLALVGCLASSLVSGIAYAKDDADDKVAGLSKSDALKLFSNCKTTAGNTSSSFGRPSGVKMWCAVLDREGTTLLIKATDTDEKPGPQLQSDAWRASIEIALAKAYTAVSVSSNDLALDSKTVGLAARLDGPGSTLPVDIGTNAGVAPLFGIGDTNPFRPGVGNKSLHPDDKTGSNHHGIVTFAGGVPVYSNPDNNCGGGDKGKLLGAVGVSGDGVDQDQAVAQGAVTGAGFCLNP